MTRANVQLDHHPRTSNGQLSQLLVLGLVLFKSVSGMSALDAYNHDVRLRAGPWSLSTIGAIQTALIVIVVGRIGLLLLRGRRIRHGDLPVLSFFGFAVLSLLWSDPGTWVFGVRELFYLALPIIIYLLVALDIAGKEHVARRFGMNMLVLLCAVSVLSLLFQNKVSAELLNAVAWDYRTTRAQGITASPNILAGMLGFLMTTALAVLLTRPIERRIRTWAWASLALASVVLVLTFSRSGWIGFGLAVMVALWVKRWWNRLWLFVAATSVVSIATGAGFIMFGDWQAFVADPTDMSVTNWQNAVARLTMWRQSIIDLTTPAAAFIGRGIGSVAVWCAGDPTCTDGGGLHSQLLQVWLDLGAVGVGLLFWMFLTFLWRAWPVARRAPTPWRRAWGLAAVASLAVAMPRLAWDFVFTGSPGILLMAIGAMAVNVSRPRIRTTRYSAPQAIGPTGDPQPESCGS